MTAVNLEAIQTLVRENLTGQLVETDRSAVLEGTTKTVNIFLRHEPLHVRATVALEMMQRTRHWLNWEDRQNLYGSVQKNPIGKADILLVRGSWDNSTLIHETIHYLQECAGMLPQNNCLTFTAETLVDLEEGKRHFLDSGDGICDLKNPNVTGGEYLQAVLDGRAHEHLSSAWILQPWPEKENDRYVSDVRTYLEHEDEFNLMFKRNGELNLPPFMGVRDPYSTIATVGSARAVRAYALGYFTGNIENAWTVLWLHGQGMKFEEAEKMVAKAYLDGTIGDFNNYDKLGAGDVERIVAMQEVFKTRKLNPLELERMEQGAGICAIGKIRKLLLDARCKASLLFDVFDAVKAVVRSIREMGPQELQQAREIYSNWAGNHFYRDSLTGKTALDITELRPYLATLATESYNADAEYAGNIFVFPDQAGYPQAKVLGTRKGFAMSSLAEQYSKRFPENIGTAHAHYYAEYSGHSIRDLVEFVTHQGHFVSVVASMNGVYVLAKTPDFDDKTQGVKRYALGAKLLQEYVENQATGQPIKELEFVKQKAKELGLAIFQLEGVDHLTESEALVLSEVD